MVTQVLDKVQAPYSGVIEVLDTLAAAPERRFALWGDLVHQTCGPLRVLKGDDEVFRGTILKGQFGAVRTALVEAAPHAVERTARLIDRSDEARLYVCAMLDGEARLSQDGNEVTASAGNLVAFDNSRPYTLAMHEPFRMVAVTFVHRLVGLTPRDTPPLSRAAWSGQHGVNGLLSRLLDGLAKHMTELYGASAERLGHSIGSLVTAMFAERLHDTAADPAAVREALLLRIQSYAREHLGDPQLTPAMLARQHNISLRYLQLLFREEQDTSPARWIRDERLARCYEDLRSPRLAHLTVASIGERWGLCGASHFGRLFRERYHLTPRECRGELLLSGCEPGEPVSKAAHRAADPAAWYRVPAKRIRTSAPYPRRAW